MPGLTEVVPVAELRPQELPKFVPSQSDNAPAPTVNEEDALRQMFIDADKKGIELNDRITVPAPAILEQPKPPVVTSFPEKFKTPEGTVDEEKLKASSKQLETAIVEKQKSIDEIIADYKVKEREYSELSQKKSELSKNPPAPPQPIQTVPFPVTPAVAADPQMAQLHQQILADMHRDPVGTTIMLNEAMLQKKLEPIMDRMRQEDEVRRDLTMRESLAKLADEDPRILNGQNYEMVKQIINEDPGIMRLKNPFKAAWNEAKGRLRLGEQARPSTPTPTLGGGAPPSVSTLPGSQTPQTLFQKAGTVNPYSDEGKAFEEQLRSATNNLWQ